MFSRKSITSVNKVFLVKAWPQDKAALEAFGQDISLYLSRMLLIFVAIFYI